jgi:hypothetical protein
LDRSLFDVNVRDALLRLGSGFIYQGRGFLRGRLGAVGLYHVMYLRE